MVTRYVISKMSLVRNSVIGIKTLLNKRDLYRKCWKPSQQPRASVMDLGEEPTTAS